MPECEYCGKLTKNGSGLTLHIQVRHMQKAPVLSGQGRRKFPRSMSAAGFSAPENPTESLQLTPRKRKREVEEQRLINRHRAVEWQRSKERHRAVEEQRSRERHRAVEEQRSRERHRAVEEQRSRERHREVEEQCSGKRRREVEEQRSVKRRRKDSPLLVEPTPSSAPLTRENLKKLCGEIESQTSYVGERKRALSRLSSNADTNQDVASVTSQKSSQSLSNYRLVTLKRARIVVRHCDIPEHVQSRVDAIIQPKISKDRKSILFSIADDLCNAFSRILKVASREDDCVEIISRSLETMNSELFGNVFVFQRKADWEPTLKPSAQRKSYRSGPADKPLFNTSDSVNRPSERQHAEASRILPEHSENNMLPPPLPSKQDMGNFKTPRPDITAGFPDSVLAEKLRILNVGKLDADEMLEDLQFDQQLCSSPTQPVLPVRFPSIVLEGKSYCTGKSMYEAENQAVVSGSCMLVVQQQLAELTQRCSPGFRQCKGPLAFSICQEGPIIHLLFHYMTKVEDARFHNSRVLAQCHATLRPTVRTFFIALVRVMEWASTELLDDIAAELVFVWKAAQQPVCSGKSVNGKRPSVSKREKKSLLINATMPESIRSLRV